MAKNMRNMKQLFDHLNKQIAMSLEDDVAKKVKKVERDMIQTEVYDKYDPTMYDRKKKDGGLQDYKNMESKLIDGKLSIENIRKDEETDRYVAPVVETGSGYDYEFKYSNTGRPFVSKTAQELEKTGQHTQALKDGLTKRGLRVK